MLRPIERSALLLSDELELTRHAKVVDRTSKRRLELECTSIRINRLFGTSTISERRPKPIPELKVLQRVQRSFLREKDNSPSA